MKRAVPRPVASFHPPPKELSPDLWVLDRQLVHFGIARLPTRTTIIRLPGGGLFVISPPPLLDPSTAEAIDSIGVVEYVLTPNSFHYVYAAEFMARYPRAQLLTAPGLLDRVPDLGPAEELAAQGSDAWSDELQYLILGPVRSVSEVLLFHVVTGTLILTDLAFNMVRYPRPLDRLVWRLSGVPGGFGPGRTSRWLLLRDRAAASRCLRRALEWPVEQIVVAHGEVVAHDVRAALRRAFGHY